MPETNYLHDRLDALYTERADLQERIRTTKENPQVAEKLRESALKSRMQMAGDRAMMADLMAAALPTSLQLESLDKELRWVEAQILAILGNPGLA